MDESAKNRQRITRPFPYQGTNIILEDMIFTQQEESVIMNDVLRMVRHPILAQDEDKLDQGKHIYLLENIVLDNKKSTDKRYLVLGHKDKTLRDQDRNTFIKSSLVSTDTVQMPEPCTRFTDLGTYYIVLRADQIIEWEDLDETTYKGVIIDPDAYKARHVDGLQNPTMQTAVEDLLAIGRRKLDSTNGVDNNKRLDVLGPMETSLKGNKDLPSLPETTIKDILESLKPSITNRFLARIDDLYRAYTSKDPNILEWKQIEFWIHLQKEQSAFVEDVKKALSAMWKTTEKEQRADLMERLKIFFAQIEKKAKS